MSKEDFGAYCPTPEEIERKTAEIRSTWSETTHRHRLGYYGRPGDRVVILIKEISDGRVSRKTSSYED